ncbi:MAG: type II toxin-antitoxin system PemK/MazF family toxin [Phycisphaerales bacterium]|nr:MAG: type II toxin-antitoxin system PemK/MazF family toxin [Phycisphaerales bacterium]
MAQGSWTPLPGHIVHAAVQYSDSERTKSRFPLVVSSRGFNDRHPEVIVAFTTKASNIRHSRDYDVEISDRRSDFKDTGLTESTTVRSGRLWSIDKRKIMDVIGVAPSDIFGDVIRLVRACFAED